MQPGITLSSNLYLSYPFLSLIDASTNGYQFEIQIETFWSKKELVQYANYLCGFSFKLPSAIHEKSLEPAVCTLFFKQYCVCYDATEYKHNESNYGVSFDAFI